jgi:hypothetical protein
MMMRWVCVPLLVLLVTLCALKSSALTYEEYSSCDDSSAKAMSCQDFVGRTFQFLSTLDTASNNDDDDLGKITAHSYCRLFHHVLPGSRRHADCGPWLEELSALLVAPVDKNGDSVVDVDEFYAFYGSLNPPGKFIEGNLPQQVHMNSVNATHRVVSWVSNLYSGAKPGAGLLLLGSEKDALNVTVTDCDTITYDESSSAELEKKKKPETDWPGWLTHCVFAVDAVTQGAGRATMYYTVGESRKSRSDVFQMEYSSQKRIQAHGARFGFVADQGSLVRGIGFMVSRVVAKHVDDMDAFFMGGDLAYADDGFQPDSGFLWDVYGRQIEPFASRIPFMTCTGNHEDKYDFMAYKARHRMPNFFDAGSDESVNYYSFVLGNVLFLALDMEASVVEGSPQYEWLKQTLKASAQQYPWITVIGHRPVYSSSRSDWDAHSPGCAFAVNLEPLFEEHSVDFYLSGHQHNYERTWPTRNGTVYMDPSSSTSVYKNPTAPVYFVIGTGGVFQDAIFKGDDAPNWSAVRRHNQYGFSHFHAHNNTHMEYKFTTVKNEVTDTLWVVKKDKLVQ